MLSEIVIQSYDDALTQCNGDKVAAAKALDIPVGQFRTNLYNCTLLREKWTKKRTNSPPVQNALLNRTALVPADRKAVEPIHTPEQAEALAAVVEAQLTDGLSKVPMTILTADEKTLATSLHSFQLRHSAAAADVVHGSVSLTAIKMTKTLNELVERYSELCDEGRGPDHGEGGSKNEASLILDQIPKFAAELRKLSEVVGKANVAKALIELKKKQDGAPKLRGKPGFRPLVAVNVQPGANVQLGGQDAKT